MRKRRTCASSRPIFWGPGWMETRGGWGFRPINFERWFECCSSCFPPAGCLENTLKPPLGRPFFVRNFAASACRRSFGFTAPFIIRKDGGRHCPGSSAMSYSSSPAFCRSHALSSEPLRRRRLWCLMHACPEAQSLRPRCPEINLCSGYLVVISAVGESHCGVTGVSRSASPPEANRVN